MKPRSTGQSRRSRRCWRKSEELSQRAKPLLDFFPTRHAEVSGKEAPGIGFQQASDALANCVTVFVEESRLWAVSPQDMSAKEITDHGVAIFKNEADRSRGVSGRVEPSSFESEFGK